MTVNSTEDVQIGKHAFRDATGNSMEGMKSILLVRLNKNLRRLTFPESWRCLGEERTVTSSAYEQGGMKHAGAIMWLVRAYGSTKVSHQIPNRTRSFLTIGSFTGTAAVLLASGCCLLQWLVRAEVTERQFLSSEASVPLPC